MPVPASKSSRWKKNDRAGKMSAKAAMLLFDRFEKDYRPEYQILMSAGMARTTWLRVTGRPSVAHYKQKKFGRGLKPGAMLSLRDFIAMCWELGLDPVEMLKKVVDRPSSASPAQSSNRRGRRPQSQ